MNSIEKSGKTIEEAVDLAIEELGVTHENIEYEILEEPSKGLFGLFGGKMARVRVTVKFKDPIAVAKEFLEQVFNTMKLEVFIEKMSQEDAIVLNLRGDDLGLLIGKHGQTLDALQYLCNLAANKNAEQRVKIIIDVEDYRKRRAETLSRLALRLADKVRRRGDRIVLEPMNPHERKIIHMALQNDRRIVTYSEGDEPFRKVVIALKK